jgi:hypothetical protein
MNSSLRKALLLLPLIGCTSLRAQTSAAPPVPPPEPLGRELAATLSGSILDTDKAAIPNAGIKLYRIEPNPNPRTEAVAETRPGHPSRIEPDTAAVASATSGADGSFTVNNLAPGTYILRVTCKGFSPWRVDDITVAPAQNLSLLPIELGVEALLAEVNAITVEDLAEQQITAEEHQRILGVLPNFFVSYVSHAQPLTSRQKFKLALVISRDPLTFATTGITAGIEQAEGDFSGYGPGGAGYGSRYAATYGDRISATFLGAAILPSLLHQDPRYFYNGHGSVIHRALYAIATTVICKGDSGHWQFNASNVFGNLGGAFIASTYYPRSDQHSVQVTVSDTMLGIAEGSIGTLFQEFLLKHLTHGAPPPTP